MSSKKAQLLLGLKENEIKAAKNEQELVNLSDPTVVPKDINEMIEDNNHNTHLTVRIDEYLDNVKERLAKTKLFVLYVFLALLFSIIDAILISFRFSYFSKQMQFLLLALSTVIFLLDLGFTYIFLDSTCQQHFTVLKIVISLLSEAGALFEFIVLVIGWIFIFINHGVSALRCLRVLRCIWHFEIIFRQKKKNSNKIFIYTSNMF